MSYRHFPRVSYTPEDAAIFTRIRERDGFFPLVNMQSNDQRDARIMRSHERGRARIVGIPRARFKTRDLPPVAAVMQFRRSA